MYLSCRIGDQGERGPTGSTGATGSTGVKNPPVPENCTGPVGKIHFIVVLLLLFVVIFDFSAQLRSKNKKSAHLTIAERCTPTN